MLELSIRGYCRDKVHNIISGHLECWEGLQEYSYKVKQPTGTEKN